MSAPHSRRSCSAAPATWPASCCACIAGHPHFELAAVMSDSQPGERVAKAFPHLASAYPRRRASSRRRRSRSCCARTAAVGGVLAPRPTASSAALIDSLLSAAAKAGTRPRVVDISADFRYSSAEAYEAVYKHAHGAPERIARVHLRGARAPEASCDNAARRASGLLRHRDTAGQRAAAVAGPHRSRRCSSAASPAAPAPDASRSRARTTRCATAICTPTTRWRTGTRRKLPPARARPPASRPTSPSCRTPGPFARGIHVTVQAQLKSPVDTPKVLAALREFYADCSVRARDRPGAAREGHRRQQLRASLRGRRTAAPSP